MGPTPVKQPGFETQTPVAVCQQCSDSVLTNSVLTPTSGQLLDCASTCPAVLTAVLKAGLLF